jgi:hypothetical protein
METIFIFQTNSLTMRHEGGLTLFAGETEGCDLSFALREHLIQFADLHDLFIQDSGALIQGGNERVVWEPGDTCARFGDFTIQAVWESDLTDKQKAVLVRAGILDEETETETEAF